MTLEEKVQVYALACFVLAFILGPVVALIIAIGQ